MRRVARIVQLATILYLSFAYLAALLYLWQIDTQRLDEAFTTLLIPAGACMLGVFAFHKFMEIRHPDPLTSVTPTLHVRCPRCQCEQSLALGESRCHRCRLRFTIAVEEPRCPNCHFNLHQLTRPTCPECGFHLDEEDVPGNAGLLPAGISDAAAYLPHPCTPVATVVTSGAPAPGFYSQGTPLFKADQPPPYPPNMRPPAYPRYAGGTTRFGV